MNTMPVNSNNNVSMQGNWWRKFKDCVGQKTIDTFKEHTFKDSARLREVRDERNDIMSSPMWNRGIMGATALVTQPVIDNYNHRVDEETRVVSRNRTIAKILAGTTVGMFVVRGPIYKAIESITNIKGTSKYAKLFLPKKFLNEIAKNETFLKNHRSALAMFIALLAMCGTNFLLDAPLTIFLTNLFNEKSGIKPPKEDDEKKALCVDINQTNAKEVDIAKQGEVKYA